MSAAIRLTCAGVLIGAFLWVFETADIGARLRQADTAWIAAAVGCLLAQTVLQAARWRLVAGCLGLRFPLGWALREYFIAQLVNQVLPGGVLGDGGRALRSRIGEGGLKRALQAVALERAAGQVGLLALAVVGLAWAVAAPGAATPLLRALGVGAVALTLLGAGLALVLRRGAIGRLLAACLPSMRVAWIHAALSLAAAALNIAAFSLCARATGTPMTAQEALLVGPLVLLAMLVPLTVAGWGWREGAAAALFPLVGAAPAAGIAAGIVFGAAMMLSALPALPLLILRRPAPSLAEIPAPTATALPREGTP